MFQSIESNHAELQIYRMCMNRTRASCLGAITMMSSCAIVVIALVVVGSSPI